MKLAFELEVPEGAIDTTVQEEILCAMKEQAALKLYASDRITTGEAAKMLGITRLRFLDLLRTSGVGFHVELDDGDFQTLRRWREDNVVEGGR